MELRALLASGRYLQTLGRAGFLFGCMVMDYDHRLFAFRGMVTPGLWIVAQWVMKLGAVLEIKTNLEGPACGVTSFDTCQRLNEEPSPPNPKNLPQSRHLLLSNFISRPFSPSELAPALNSSEISHGTLLEVSRLKSFFSAVGNGRQWCSNLQNVWVTPVFCQKAI